MLQRHPLQYRKIIWNFALLHKVINIISIQRWEEWTTTIGLLWKYQHSQETLITSRLVLLISTVKRFQIMQCLTMVLTFIWVWNKKQCKKLKESHSICLLSITLNFKEQKNSMSKIDSTIHTISLKNLNLLVKYTRILHNTWLILKANRLKLNKIVKLKKSLSQKQSTLRQK